MKHNQGDTVTIKVIGKDYIKRAEIIHIPEDKDGLWQFLDMETMRVVEMKRNNFGLSEYSPGMFTEYCKCETPKAEPHPNGRDILCTECQLIIKI